MRNIDKDDAMASNSPNTLAKIPSTPSMARRLFSRLNVDGESPPIPSTDAEKLCHNEPFHTTVSRLLFQAIPTLELEIIDSTIKSFFMANHVNNENGLSSLVPETDLPDILSLPTESYWQITLFRRAMATVITGCSEFRLLPNTPYNLLLQRGRIGLQAIPRKSSSVGDVSKIYCVKTVASVTLQAFSGLTSDFKEWYDSVTNAYGICGHQKFLDSEQICSLYDAVSYSIKCNLSVSLRDGTLAYLCEEMKSERNAHKFLNGIKAAADEKADHRNREFKQWLDLFTLKLEKPEDCYSFINKFSLCISALKEAKSAAVMDDILLRALLLQSIQYEEFAEIKLEITKNLDIKPTDIIRSLKAHKLALDSEEQFKDGNINVSPPRQVRRSNVNDGNEKFGTTKPNFRIPRWPKGLYEVCTKSLWKQLSVWKMLVNKEILNGDGEKRLRDFTIHSDRVGSDDDRLRNSRPPRDDQKNEGATSRRSRYSNDRSRDNSSARTRFTDDTKIRGSPYKRDDTKRSSKTNRHSYDSRRVRRGSKRDRSSSEDDDSDSSQERFIRSRRSRRQDSDQEDSSARRILMGGVLRN